MDLNLTGEEVAFGDEFRSWLEINAPKDWSSWREKPLEESFTYLRTWQRRLHEGGWAAVSWPKEYGGRRAPLMQAALFLGENGAGRGASHGQRLGSRIDRADDHRLRHGSPEKAVHSRDS